MRENPGRASCPDLVASIPAAWRMHFLLCGDHCRRELQCNRVARRSSHGPATRSTWALSKALPRAAGAVTALPHLDPIYHRAIFQKTSPSTRTAARTSEHLAKPVNTEQLLSL